jgi:RsiW-degrading membrane proteinase PrsW (M82 family)
MVQDSPDLARVGYERRAASIPIIVEIGAVVLFAAIVAVLAGVFNPRLEGAPLILAGLVLAIVPALLWLATFYRLDRVEPEPKHYVFGVFMLGGILAAAVGEPVIRGVFQVQEWTYDGLISGLLGSIFVVGFVEQFLIYAAVRYTVFNSREYDSRVDGILYGAAAGLGYATMINIVYVVGNAGVDLGVGAIQVAITALAQASFAGLMGYFLGRAKFDSMGPFWLPLGLTISSVLNGVVSFVLRELPTIGGLTYNPWYGLVVAAVVAGATFFVVFSLMHRLNTQDEARINAAPAAGGAR